MKHIAKILAAMKQHVGNTKAVVLFDSPFKVLVSTVLSQRTRDANTKAAAKKLFSKFSTPKQLAGARVSEISRLIKKSGFYKVKARYIKELSQQLVSEFHGKVPDSLEELLSLRGVGRKTASCTFLYGHHISCIPVDVHVAVISNRLGLVKNDNPDKIQTALEKRIPKKYWGIVNHLFVVYGQKICLTRKPKCNICHISKYCDYFKYHK